MSHGHNTDDYVQLKDAIEGLIKKVRIFECGKGRKRESDESSKGKSLSKTVDVRTSGESNEAIKGKTSYIISITGGAP